MTSEPLYVRLGGRVNRRAKFSHVLVYWKTKCGQSVVNMDFDVVERTPTLPVCRRCRAGDDDGR